METDDQRHYDEAEAWLELGNLAEAEAALALISPGVREQPAVLEMRFHICAQTDRWEEAYELGKDFIFIEPDGLNAPSLLARALHRMGRSREAYDTLKPACEAFPDESGPDLLCAWPGRGGAGVAGEGVGDRRGGAEIAGVGRRGVGGGVVSCFACR
jgi:predicted Zn-dependent protease